MPDLDLIKQEKQERATGAGGRSLTPCSSEGRLWISACARTMDLRVREIFDSLFPREEEKGDTAMNGVNEWEH